MDDHYYRAVTDVFVDLYNKGLIYRGKRMVNWDPVGLTALSDEEVIFKETDSKLYYVKYKAASGEGAITVATTRPETILGDAAICVNPADERYKDWVGKEVMVPVINRKIPVIADEYVTADFGTGALKVTPAHDKNDNMLGEKYNLAAIDTLDPSGKFSSKELETGLLNEQVLSYNGIDRFELRKKIAEDIAALGLLEKTENYKGQVGTSERTGAVIESRLSLQWFIDMKAFLQKNPDVLASVLNDEIKFYPAKFKNLYRHWLENIKDWCISRQLWWGQRIPAWYDANGNYVVAATKEEATKLYLSKYGQQSADDSPQQDANGGQWTVDSGLIQDEDVLDTWFSSWLWPMEVFKGISNPDNNEISYYYPTQTLVTAPEIIFFWVARMIMAGNEYKHKKPFSEVYFTGIVRDKQGRKMSKSLGNSPDLLEMIEKDGADAVRFGIMIASPAGNDLMWDPAGNEQGRFFINKMWNALKLVKSLELRATSHEQAQSSQLTAHSFATDWFENRLNEVKAELDTQFRDFRLSEALKTIYSLIWDDFCSWYLEWVKPGFEQPIDKKVYEKTVGFFEELMQLLHPFMPFITEEIYHQLKEREDDITVKQITACSAANKDILQHAALLKEIITAIREARVKAQLKNKDGIQLYILSGNEKQYNSIKEILAKQVNAESIAFTPEKNDNCMTLVIQKDTFFIASNTEIDISSQKEQLLKDLTYYKGFLQTIEKKLGNERFVANAKSEVVALEQKKKDDALSKIKVIEESLAKL